MGLLYVPLEEGAQEEMRPDQWSRLAEYYGEDVARLSELLRRDVTHWLKRPADRHGRSANATAGQDVSTGMFHR